MSFKNECRNSLWQQGFKMEEKNVEKNGLKVLLKNLAQKGLKMSA